MTDLQKIILLCASLLVITAGVFFAHNVEAPVVDTNIITEDIDTQEHLQNHHQIMESAVLM